LTSSEVKRGPQKAFEEKKKDAESGEDTKRTGRKTKTSPLPCFCGLKKARRARGSGEKTADVTSLKPKSR